MPSKRKKNKRRMRRVQAQRRLLEEQYAASPPVKASPALAVGAPGTVSSKIDKKVKPAPVIEVVAKVPEKVPIAVPVVEAPKVEPKVEPPKEEPVIELPPVKVELPAEPEPEPEVVVLEKIPVEVEIPDVPVPTTADEPIVKEEPIITEEPEIIESPIVEVLPEEPATVEVVEDEEEEEEPIIPEPELDIEVIQAEADVAAPAEIQVVQEEAPIITEIEQTHGVCEPEPQVEAQVTFTDYSARAFIEKTEVVTIVANDEEQIEQYAGAASIEPEPIKVVEMIGNVEAEASSETEGSEDEEEEPVEMPEDEPKSVEPELVEPEALVAEVKAATQGVESESEEEESYSSEEEEDDCEMEVLTEETNQITQDAPIPNGAVTVESDALSLPPLTIAPEPVTQAPVDTADVMVDDFVITDTSAEVTEPTAIELIPVFEKPTAAVCEIFGLGPAKTIPEPELDTSTEDVLTDDAADSLESCPIEEASLTNNSVNMFVGTEWIKQTTEVSSLEI